MSWDYTEEGAAFEVAERIAAVIRTATRNTGGNGDPWIESNGTVLAGQVENAVRLTGNTMQVRERAAREARYHESVVAAEREATETEAQYVQPEQTETAPIRVRVTCTGEIEPGLVQCSLSVTLLKD